MKNINLFKKSLWVFPLFLFPAFVLIFHLSSCNKYKDDFDFDKLADPEWNPEFAVPLINSTHTIGDFFSDSGNLTIRANPDNSLSFVYSGKEVFSQTAGELLKFPDQDFSLDQEFPVPPIPPGFYDTVTISKEFKFITDTSKQRIDSIFMKSGMLHIAGETNLNKDEAQLLLELPNLTHLNTGETLIMIASLNNPGGQQAWVSFDESFDLSQYKLFFNNKPEDKNNFKLNISLVIHGDENPDLSPYDFNISCQLDDLDFEKVFGYLGTYSVNLKDSIPISLFDKTVTGGFQIGDDAIDLSITAHNSIGAPVLVTTNELFVYSPVNPPYYKDIYLFGQGNPNFFNVQAPDISQVGQTVTTELDFSHTNFDDAFNMAPELFYYDFEAFTNPMGDTLKQNFFIDTSRLSFDVDLEVKLFASIGDFSVEDTLGFNLNYDNPEEIDYLTFRVNALNGFPVNAAFQVYFTDASYQVVDSLITDPEENIVEGAPTNGPPEYKVTNPVLKTTDINIGKTRIDRLLQADKMLLRANLSTTDGELAILYEDYSLQLKIGIITGLSITNTGGE